MISSWRFRSTIANHGATAARGLIAHLNHADRELAALLMGAVQAGLSAAEWDALLATVTAS